MKDNDYFSAENKKRTGLARRERILEKKATTESRDGSINAFDDCPMIIGEAVVFARVFDF